jgi:hypothetical protein
VRGDFYIPRINAGARARICKPFMEPRNRFPAVRAGTTTHLSYRPARLLGLAESIPRFLKRSQIRAQATLAGGIEFLELIPGLL